MQNSWKPLPITTLIAFIATVLATNVNAFTSSRIYEDRSEDVLIDKWKEEWPKTDFSRSIIDLKSIMAGGPKKDGIPPIDNPKFIGAEEAYATISGTEPVISISINEKARAYPLRVLTWHEIVNDTFASVPITITYCPLCNASIVFYRVVDGKILDFGTTGKLRNSDLVMYDRDTESWWQQYIGKGIIGKFAGKTLQKLPSRVESLAEFVKRHPDGDVLVPNDPEVRAYGATPYPSYDTSTKPFLYTGTYKGRVAPMSYLVVVGDEAWPLSLLERKKTITKDNITLTWSPGQNSALDTRSIASGRDIGNVVVTKDGKDTVYHVTFAFVFDAFQPEGKVHY